MTGSLEGRLTRAEQEFGDKNTDFIELASGERINVGAMQIVNDWLDVMRGGEIDDDRARLYVDAIESPCHGGMMAGLIKNCQNQIREES